MLDKKKLKKEFWKPYFTFEESRKGLARVVE
jgi:hypothetical protein